MKTKYILIGAGVLLIGGGIAYYFLSNRKGEVLAVPDDSIKVDDSTLIGVTMSSPPISSKQPFRQTSTVKRINMPIQSAAAFSSTKKK